MGRWFREHTMIPILHLWFRVQRGMTMGVRAVVKDSDGRVFLVRHSYLPGWHFPGGGVEVGQTCEQALAMELSEEGNLTMTKPAQLFGVYLNRQTSRRDHVLLYLVENAVQSAPKLPNHEIVETGFFPPESLPETTSPATRRRLDEIAGRSALSREW
ncbi:COG1051 ADP-ribose pyrophosphatase [Rhabdaerophilaceae bacterium]